MQDFLDPSYSGCFGCLTFFCSYEFNCFKKDHQTQKLLKCFFLFAPLLTEARWQWQNLDAQFQAGRLFGSWKWLSRTNNPHRDGFIAVDSSSTGAARRDEVRRFSECNISAATLTVTVFVAAAVPFMKPVWPLPSPVISELPLLFTFIFCIVSIYLFIFGDCWQILSQL